MDNSAFLKELRKKMTEIKKRRIWQRANLVLSKFGQERIRVENCYTAVEKSFERTIDGRKLKISRDSHGQFHENFTVKIYVDNTLVFRADNTVWVEKRDPRIILKFGNKSIEIEYYCSGNWTGLLNPKKIEMALRPKKETKPLPPKPEFSLSDKELAQRFGIKSSNPAD